MSQMNLNPTSSPQQMQWIPATPQPMGPTSTQVVCTSCGHHVYSSTSRKAKASAWWSCILMCICGCFCGCCLIPCCMDSCNVVNHKCPRCNTFLGQYTA